jgi:hypothetical protein
VVRSPCQALNGWTVCRFHGARGGAPKGKANGSYKHGLYTQEAKAERRWDSSRQSEFAVMHNTAQCCDRVLSSCRTGGLGEAVSHRKP